MHLNFIITQLVHTIFQSILVIFVVNQMHKNHLFKLVSTT